MYLLLILSPYILYKVKSYLDANKGLVSVSEVKTKLKSGNDFSFLLEVGFPRGTVGEELRTFLGGTRYISSSML